MKKIKEFVGYLRTIQMSKAMYFSLALFVLLAGITAVASGTDVTACVTTKTGAVRVINFVGGDCSKAETKMVWNMQGVKGDTGAQGPKGDIGPAGAQLHLYDANNQDLGIVMHGPDGENTTEFQTLLPNLGLLTTIKDTNKGPTDSHMNAGHSTGFLFTGPDCTGDRFTTIIIPLAVLRDAVGRHFTVATDNLATRIGLSSFDGSGTCNNQAAYSYDNSSLLQEVTLPFSEPILKPLHVALP